MDQARIEMWRLLLKKLVENATAAYQTSQSDRKRLHTLEWEDNGNGPSILGEAEVRCDAIVGLAQTYLEVGLAKLERDETIDMLRNSSTYYTQVLLEWLLQEGSEYRAFASYLHAIECVRMFLSGIVATVTEKTREN